jgi:hypothetical protein
MSALTPLALQPQTDDEFIASRQKMKALTEAVLASWSVKAVE